MRYVNQPVMKKDGMALVTGKPVYTQDLAPKDCLVVKVLRSPHASAKIKSIDKSRAEKVEGIVCILTHEDCPNRRFTQAGQTFWEMSPYDRYILEDRVRFVGDAVAVIAGENEKAVKKAMKLVKVEYEVLTPLLDFRTSKGNEILVHPEDDWKANVPVGGDAKQNLCASGGYEGGDLEAVFADCDLVLERTFHKKANNQTMMEPFNTYCTMDTYGRLTVVSSTQIPFHIRRIVANALDIPKSKVRVVKPRIGGGFGAKQTGVSEVYAALVTWKTGRPAKIEYTRYEAMIASSPRHEMQVRVKMGFRKDGKVRAIDMYTLSNTGAYGEHGPTTVGLTAEKSMPLYTPEAFRFKYDVVYTNVQASGAYRGYGATQGIFAAESLFNEAMTELGLDPVAARKLNYPVEGQVMHAYHDLVLKSCRLGECLERARTMIGWDSKYPMRVTEDGKLRGVGVASAMQGSGIAHVDVGSITIRLSDEGTYNMVVGCSDMGTGCDTILAQMAADVLECEFDDISVYGVDTDTSPYDSGSYASSTTYITGMATVKACGELKEKIRKMGAEMLEIPGEEAEFDGKTVHKLGEPEKKVTLMEIATKRMLGCDVALEATASHHSPVSPPPFMCGMAEVEVDPETGKVDLIDYVAVVDCGTVINPNLSRRQTEGGLVQGIGMALYEDINYTATGYLKENSFMQYKIPCRQEIPDIRVEFEESYEPTGPFGAKSIGEVVINTPLPAIAQAIYNATGLRFYEPPFTPEKILRGLKELKGETL